MERRNKAKKWLKINILWIAVLVTSIIASSLTTYVIQNTIYVKGLPVAEDPLEAWSEASYVVWEYNSTHYACRNMSTNMVVGTTGESLGTSDDNAIQWAIDNSTAKGGTVYVKCPHTLGTYNAAVTLKDKVRLVLENGAAGISVTIDTNATATLMDYHNFSFKRWDNGVLVGFVEDRSQAEQASYTIFKEGSFYFAKNGTTGAIDYSGTNASQVIQNAINNGGKIFIKDGIYESDPPISVNTPTTPYTVIEGESWNATFQGIGINFYGGGAIKNLKFDMEGTQWACISARNIVEWKVIEHNLFKGGGGCVQVDGTTDVGVRYYAGKVVIKDNEFWNVNSSEWGCIVYEQTCADIWIEGNKFYESNRPFIEASSEVPPYSPIDDVWVLNNEFVGPQTVGDPMYPMCQFLADNGTNLYVIGNVWKPREESGLDTYRNRGIALTGNNILFANNFLYGCELNWTVDTTPTKNTSMIVGVLDAENVQIIGNYFYGDVGITTYYRSANITSLKISDNTFDRIRYSAISLGNNALDYAWSATAIEISDNVFTDWDYSDDNLYQCIATDGRNATYTSKIETLSIRDNQFYKLTDGTYARVGHVVFGNDAVAPNDIDVTTLIIEGNLFNVTTPLEDFTCITPITQVIRFNVGYQYLTENSGQEVGASNGDWVAHGLAGTPLVVVIAPHSNVNSWTSNRNATHFQIGLSGGTDLDWYAEYRP